jgi:hypothetical protein
MLSEWAKDARCLPINGRGPGGVYFFSDDPDEQLRAVSFCEGCPVREQCLAEQMQWENEHPGYGRFGVFGGKTAQQREELACEQ